MPTKKSKTKKTIKPSKPQIQVVSGRLCVILGDRAIGIE